MRLLLIEDDEVVRSTLDRDLQRTGYAVDCATDGERGEFLGATEQYDLVVLDLGLPRMSGLEVLRRWRASGVMVRGRMGRSAGWRPIGLFCYPPANASYRQRVLHTHEVTGSSPVAPTIQHPSPAPT